MSNDLSKKQKRGTPLNPSERGSDSANPQKNGEQQNEETKEGEYRNVETSVNNPSYFDDDYEVEQENEISRKEAETEDENNVPNRRGAGQS
jgi:hypothetical protein